MVSLDNESGKTVTVTLYRLRQVLHPRLILPLLIVKLCLPPDPTTKLTPLTQNITFTVKGDNLNEATEHFTITLGVPTNGDITGANIIGTITIADNDHDLPTLTIADAEGE